MIEVRGYVAALGRWWRLLVLGPVLGAAAALAVSLLLPRTYEAAALIVVTRPRYQIQFEPRFQTVPVSNNTLAIPSKAYMALARNSHVERQVVAALDRDLDPEEREPGALLERIKVDQAGGARGDPNVFEIRAQASDPGKAQRIANTWAGEYVKLASELYGQSTEMRTSLSSELKVASENLHSTEDALVQFQRTNTVPALQQRIEATKKVLESYLTATGTTVAEIVSGQVSAQMRLYNDTLAARNNVRIVRQDAASLREQLRADPSGSATNSALPALLLQIQSLNSGARGAVQLQIPMSQLQPASSRETQLRQIEGLIQALDDQEMTLTRRIDEMVRELTEGRALNLGEDSKENPVSALITQTTRELQDLQGQLQSEQNELDRRTRARDLAMTTYSTLANKAEEARIDAGTRLREVQIASQADRPRHQISPRTPLNVALAAVVSLVLVFCLVFGLEQAGVGTADQTGRAPAEPGLGQVIRALGRWGAGVADSEGPGFSKPGGVEARSPQPRVPQP